MPAFRLQVPIGPDGNLRLEVPAHLPEGIAEVLIVVEAASDVQTATTNGSRSGLFTDEPAQDFDLESAFAELNNTWKMKLLRNS